MLLQPNDEITQLSASVIYNIHSNFFLKVACSRYIYSVNRTLKLHYTWWQRFR